MRTESEHLPSLATASFTIERHVFRHGGAFAGAACGVWLPFILVAHAFTYGASRLFGGAIRLRNWVTEQDPWGGRHPGALATLPPPWRRGAALWWCCLAATAVMFVLSSVAGEQSRVGRSREGEFR